MMRIPDSLNIALYCKGCWYRANAFYNRRLVRYAELEKTLQAITGRKHDPVEKKPILAALIAGSRDL
uniref:Uncharacterized protein n=1 Tax=Panagrolaimus sp. PS1159 TaxID=55785 RepID=A0AC35FA13_9BILA